jgi:hypothetical protein
MKKNNRNILIDDLNLRDVLIILWKEKILILFTTLIFVAIGFVYSNFKPKEYTTKITLRELTPFLIDEYQSFSSSFLQEMEQQSQQVYIYPKFNDEFKLNLLSVDTMVEFVETNNELNEFKSYLKDNNISIRKYFFKKFERSEEKIKFHPSDIRKPIFADEYTLTFQKPLPGEKFLNDYIIFVKEKTEKIYIQQISYRINNHINIYRQNLEIAKKINLDDPILKSMNVGNAVVNEPTALFYKGTKVLSERLVHLNELLNKTKSITLGYNPILEKASNALLITRSLFTILAFFFWTGFFFSIIIIFIKLLLKNKI